MDWLLERQGHIEAALAERHLHDDIFALYDLTSTYFEGRTCPLAKLGHSRDGKSDKLQIVFGLLCDSVKNRVRLKTDGANEFDQLTTPTPLQQRAFDLLKVPCRL